MANPNKTAAFSAAMCVALMWLFMLTMLLMLFGMCIGLALGLLPRKVTISRHSAHMILESARLFICLGMIYLALALSLRCPHCGFQFLKNPKGMRPSGFTYNEDCPRLRGVSPWAYQIGRLLATRQFRCIKCGQEVFEKGKLVA
jgi:DNA-directed RNA polymerase subunit RPC12/RpoP